VLLLVSVPDLQGRLDVLGHLYEWPQHDHKDPRYRTCQHFCIPGSVLLADLPTYMYLLFLLSVYWSFYFFVASYMLTWLMPCVFLFLHIFFQTYYKHAYLPIFNLRWVTCLPACFLSTCPQDNLPASSPICLSTFLTSYLLIDSAHQMTSDFLFNLTTTLTYFMITLLFSHCSHA
jgi:hypothetical protein